MKEILEKIRKLLAVAERSTFPEEAATALAKAQALMIENNIREAELSVQEEIEVSESPIHNLGKQRTSWKIHLANCLSKENGCAAFLDSTQGGILIRITGRASNVNTVLYLFDYCIRSIDSLTKRHCKGKGRNYATNFRLGCVDAIESAIRAEKEELRKKEAKDQGDQNLPLVIHQGLVNLDRDAEAARKFQIESLGLKSVKIGKLISNPGARDHGRREGAGIYRGNRKQIRAPREKIS